MATAFGPQGPNFATVRPAADPKVSAVATWFRNCSAPGAKEGTYATADFFNVIVANLRELVSGAGIALDDAVDTMVFDAVKKIVDDAIAAAGTTYTGSHGIVLVGNDFRLALGTNTLPVLTV